jgi:hypothetical protein
MFITQSRREWQVKGGSGEQCQSRDLSIMHAALTVTHQPKRTLVCSQQAMTHIIHTLLLHKSKMYAQKRH